MEPLNVSCLLNFFLLLSGCAQEVIGLKNEKLKMIVSRTENFLLCTMNYFE
jgi:hypothetical protein